MEQARNAEGNSPSMQDRAVNDGAGVALSMPWERASNAGGGDHVRRTTRSGWAVLLVLLLAICW